ncbi:hypothetical protein ACFFU9_12840 [Mariniflexile ostreae]|uniref:DUF4304 domain-containing protein n=1 Tax=Mariniflexile ostreae TaxID=1520892 RepID=A0ABV5FDW0_9FLAO
MNRELYIQIIRNECDFLEKEGYLFSKIENNIFYKKESNYGEIRIRFNWIEYGDKFITQGLTVEKRFNEVEEVILKIVEGELGNYYTIYKNPCFEDIQSDLNYTELENNIRFETYNIRDIKLFAKTVKAFYSNTVLKYLKRYESLNALDKELKSLLDSKTIQSIFTSLENTTILRFCIVAFICNNKDILTFFDNIYLPYLKDNSSNELNKTELNGLLYIQSVFRDK